MKIKKLTIIIPAYNEEKTVGKVIEEALFFDLGDREREIIIINDGSTDGTGEIIDKFKDKCKVIHHQRNMGKGAAMRTGLENATGDYIIPQDADLELDLNDIRKIVEKAEQENAIAVYGSRLLNNHRYENINILYFSGGRMITFFTNLLYRIHITDGATCYKLLNRSWLESVGIESTGFEFCPEITSKIALSRNKIYEVPISYFPRSKKGGKKLKWFRDGWRVVFTLLKYRFRK